MQSQEQVGLNGIHIISLILLLIIFSNWEHKVII